MTNVATVEVLTAEVRVLMVGSRQVTLSVYNQLDWAHYTDIEPFGRVNPKGTLADHVYVVGRERESGGLVRSRALTWDMVREPSLREVADADVRVWTDTIVHQMECAQLAAISSVAQSRAQDADGENAAAWNRLMKRCDAELVKREDQRDWMIKDNQNWEELPLIVLAGLR
jgi:hypothetical protein